MAEERRLAGGSTGGAVRVGDTVRREIGPWTPAVHALLDHLESKGFGGAPRARGIDEQGREVLTFLAGETVSAGKPQPTWVHADGALDDVSGWLRHYHEVVADFVPDPHAVWRTGAVWKPGLIIGHNDTTPYNAVWRDRHLAGFFDWDFAGPVSREWDLAFAAFSWVPLHARFALTKEGFPDIAVGQTG
ncbi:MAG: phosphotransferase [Mycobacteriales bacterium]